MKTAASMKAATSLTQASTDTRQSGESCESPANPVAKIPETAMSHDPLMDHLKAMGVEIKSLGDEIFEAQAQNFQDGSKITVREFSNQTGYFKIRITDLQDMLETIVTLVKKQVSEGRNVTEKAFKVPDKSAYGRLSEAVLDEAESLRDAGELTDQEVEIARILGLLIPLDIRQSLSNASAKLVCKTNEERLEGLLSAYQSGLLGEDEVWAVIDQMKLDNDEYDLFWSKFNTLRVFKS